MLVALSPFASAQTLYPGKDHPGLEVPEAIPGPGWKTCPRCQNDAHVEAARKKYQVEGHKFDPHDLSGVWGNNGIKLDFKKAVLTPYGKKLYDATKAAVSPAGISISNSQDPMLICDPLGWPRSFTYNYGFEFVQMPDRIFEFFEWGHTWRTIWMDGRKLPTDPPYQRYEGYAIGRWEGDTLVVESNGFDDRSWIIEDNRNSMYGFPHSTDLSVVERYKRLDYGTLEATMTITDPKIYQVPWTSTGRETLRPGAEIGEYFCVPSESINFDNHSTVPSTGATVSPYLKGKP
jgi:hypothetical protein